MRFTEEPIKGIVTDVKDGLSIKTELGSLIHWKGCFFDSPKLGDRVLILYDFERGKVKAVVRETEMSEHVEEGERDIEFEEEEIDYEGIFDRIEGGELNS